MKILVTGASGFVGKNLVTVLKEKEIYQVFAYDVNNTIQELEEYIKVCDFVIHLAGINRPVDPKDFMTGNYGFTLTLLDLLKKYNNKSPILLSSSIQAELNNPYGVSKKAGEDLLITYGQENKIKVLIYRFNNLFGKWCKPNYNSVVATFCHNIANDLPIQINDPKTTLKLTYIDDVIEEIINAINNKPHINELGYGYVQSNYDASLQEIADLLISFKESRITGYLPDITNDFKKKLYSTYLTYLPYDKFGYPLVKHEDHRGSFTEFFKTLTYGQVSINVTKPGEVKGNHYHHTKTEKFLTIKGQGIIRLRNIFEDKVIEYLVSEKEFQIIDIPPGFTHNLENTGNEDMITLIWANEIFSDKFNDTIYMSCNL